MKKLDVLKHLTILTVFLFYAGQSRAGVADDVRQLQKRWTEANYTLAGDAREEAFVELVDRARQVTGAYPDSADAWIWNGIIQSSYAGVKGGLGALGLVKEARSSLEKALSLDAKAMQGSACTSLGALYFKVPGWPIAFGDDDKAEQLLKQGLELNPDGIDSNYFYAEFLVEQGSYEQARVYLQRAGRAAPRPDRPVADEGRQREISVLLDDVEEMMLAALEEDEDF